MLAKRAESTREKVNNSFDKQWGRPESIVLGGTIVILAIAVVTLPFLAPRDLVSSWPTSVRIYEFLGAIFPYLSRSLPLSSEPDFYVFSKLILFALGFLCVAIFSLIPLTKKIVAPQRRQVEYAKKTLWWSWILFAVVGYGIFFGLYRQDANLSWASRAAVDSRFGIAVGNFAQFGVFALVAMYAILIRHYLRLRSVWETEHGKERRESV